MNKIITTIILSGFTSIAMASPSPVVPVSDYPKQNKINYQLSEQDWVNTNTAKVTVTVNASLDQKKLENIQTVIQTSLKKLADADWRIINFNRNQSQSGLETVNAMAQARIPTKHIKDIRAKATSLNEPGIKYEISNINYQPTVKELQNANVKLRQQIYKKVQSEIDLLDKTFNHEDFYVQNITFNPSIGAIPARATTNNMVMMKKQATTPAENISQKVTLNAEVTIASTVESDDD